jgi:hypothetical protein
MALSRWGPPRRLRVLGRPSRSPSSPLAVGYANPSHFAQLFRRETVFSPSDYRRQR